MPHFQTLLGDGSQWGLELSYAIQPRPEGLAQAFVIGADFIGHSNCCLILGDNIFFGHGLPQLLADARAETTGGTVFAYHVADPERYGVVEFDKAMKAVSIEEKPRAPKSNWAVAGLYFYDPGVVEIAANLKPSSRGEYEITDVNLDYLQRGKLRVSIMGRGYAWLDTGTPESLLEAGDFVRTLEKRQGFKIACPEEIALGQGFISSTQFEKQAERYGKSDYGNYLRGLLQ
jgi:glucose-1-phosphate thymidylyltransferase